MCPPGLHKEGWSHLPVTEATEAVDATDAVISLSAAAEKYIDIRDGAETWRKYVGRAEVKVILLYKTLASGVDTPGLGKLYTVVSLRVLCAVSQDVRIVVVACVVASEMVSQKLRY